MSTNLFAFSNVNRQLRDDNLQRCQQGRTLHPLYDFATAMPIFDFPAMADDARQLPRM